MKKEYVRKKEEKAEVKKRKKIFTYGVIALLSILIIYLLTTYLLSINDVINKGNFRLNDFVVTSMVKVDEETVDIYNSNEVMQSEEENIVEEIENDINNSLELKLNISQLNKISFLIPTSENATIADVYLTDIKIKKTDFNIYMLDRELINKYSLIKTPEELLEFMDNNINYGYLGKNNKVYYFGDVDFDKDWYHEYILESKDDILRTGIGNCFDQTEL